MPRGKKGPVPDSLTEPLEQQEPLGEDPDTETIIGTEHIINVDEPDNVAVIDAHLADKAEDARQQQQADSGYKCVEAGCTFRSNFLSEIEEHCNGTGHGGFKTAEQKKPEQPELFSEPGTITRSIKVPMEADFLNKKREKLADLYQRILDTKGAKSAADADFNEQIKGIDAQMQEIARILQVPYTYTNAKCVWRIIDGENARGLYRIDTGELVEKRALTAEDRAQEIEQVATVNEAVVPPVEPEKAAEETIAPEAAIPVAEEVAAETLA